MTKHEQTLITGDMLVRYYELNKQKKEIELEMNELKDVFQDYFNSLVGSDRKGEITISGYKLQRLIRKTEKYIEDETVRKLEELQLNDLIQIVKKPDDQKIKAALSLGLINPEQLEGCVATTVSPAISVKPVTPR
ncbi:hypothetical protein [Neobacillus dielmonensis]|uniref:hypothetical protein n=1 Tax=Neobacillus dielmonensis TaxID=1347369 RepID=UPI000AFD68B5|nr:hypothetical protein [Neobacillus dielmonensis]